MQAFRDKNSQLFNIALVQQANIKKLADQSAARLFCAQLQADDRISDFRVLASHQESLHSHDAVSLLTQGPTFAADSLDPRLFSTLFHQG